MKKLILVLLAAFLMGTICCSTQRHRMGLKTLPQPDTRFVKTVSFSDQVLRTLRAEWLQSFAENKERGGCIKGYFDKDTLFVEEAIPARENVGAERDKVFLDQQPRCYGRRFLGFYHTHILWNQYRAEFSMPDANSRFANQDVLSVLVWGVKDRDMGISFVLSTGYTEHVALRFNGEP